MRYLVILLITIAIVFIIFSYKQKNLDAPDNAILIIKPYWHNGTWVFDDKRVDLYQEPFVAGMPEIINQITKDIPNAKNGFRLLFSVNPFPSYQIRLTWLRKENDGNWYYSDSLKMEGWLCPALFKYYKKTPKKIYAKAETIDE
ncbi:MAG: DUF6717 family protein [bacterium]